MNERDRMLAEGPRVAPEARTAGTTALAVADQPGLPTGRSSFPLPPARLVPLAVVAFFLVASFIGLGRFVWIVFVAGAVITALQRRRKARC
jgi:hypothetical protein